MYVFKFGVRLRLWRESKGLTQWQLQKLTGINRANLSSIELGRRPASDDILEKLASIPELDITVTELKVWKRLNGATIEELKMIRKYICNKL